MSRLDEKSLICKNIVVYSKNLPPDKVGGIETNAFYLIKSLLDVPGVRLHIVTLTKRKFLLFRSKRIAFGSRRVTVHLLKKKQAGVADGFVRLLARLRCAPAETVIYHNTLDLHGLFAEIRDRGYKQVARSGGNDMFSLKPDRLSKSVIENCNALNRLFVNSEYSYRRAANSGLKEQILRVIKGGCTRELGQPSALRGRGPVILSCCRLVDFKGLDDAIDACHQLDKDGLEFTYLIIGDGALREQLQARIALYGLENKCRLLGKMPPEQVHNYYQAADIYLSTSKDVVRNQDDAPYIHTETMGRSLCEAQIHGLPVVTTDSGGSPEMVQNGVTGLVVQQGNAESIAQALGMLIRDADKRSEMGKSAAIYAQQNLSWDAVFQKLMHEINELD